jgi:hypothetical protein
MLSDLKIYLSDRTHPYTTPLTHSYYPYPRATPQCTNSPVTTRDLTTAFGWTSQEAFLQQDVQVRVSVSHHLSLPLFPSLCFYHLLLPPPFFLFFFVSSPYVTLSPFSLPTNLLILFTISTAGDDESIA